MDSLSEEPVTRKQTNKQKTTYGVVGTHISIHIFWKGRLEIKSKQKLNNTTDIFIEYIHMVGRCAPQFMRQNLLYLGPQYTLYLIYIGIVLLYLLW